MTGQGRLIINTRGETAKVINDNPARLQIAARLNNVYPFALQHFVTAELELNPREMIALAAQLADVAGYAAEFTKVSPRVTAHYSTVPAYPGQQHDGKGLFTISKTVPAKPGEGR